jgi:hypothetical protein
MSTMVKKQISKKQFIIYLIVAFGLAWILQIVASIFANKGNEIVFRGILAGCMYMPFLGVLVARIPLKGISSFVELHCEIEKILISDKLVDNWTYPLIQPILIEEAKKRGFI